MLVQYLKLIIRDLIKRKSFSLINILGLALGFTVCLSIVLYVYTEFSFDRYIPDGAHKYRIVWGQSDDKNAILPYPFKEELEAQMPQDGKMCLRVSVGTQQFTHNQRTYKFDNTLLSDSCFVSMFGTKLIQGNRTILNTPNQLILSEKAARKIFGNSNPINQTLRYGNREYAVTGVFNDLPKNSHLDADVVISILSFKTIDPESLTSWGYKSFDYYLSLPPKTNLDDFRNRIRTAYLKADPSYMYSSNEETAKIGFELQPITDIHLKSGYVLWDEDKNKGSFSMVITFIIIGLLILLMASFNYINLSTAFFHTKNKLAGIQRTLGAKARNLLLYIYMQTTIMVICSFLLSLVFLRLMLPYFNTVVSRGISFSLLGNPLIVLIVILLLVFMIVFSGSYPAKNFSFKKPVEALKGDALKSHSGIPVRRVLVISQFVISISLIAGVLIMGKQIRMMSAQKLGFNSDQLIEVYSEFDKEHYTVFKDKLQALSGVAAVSAASSTPANYIDNENPFRLSIETDEENRQGSALVGALPDYFDVMHIRILQGEAFSQSAENKEVAILSKTAVEMLHVPDIIGKRIYQSMTEKDYTVIGIADDVQYRSLREKMTPVIYVSNFYNYKKIVIRLNKGNHLNTIAAIEKCWQSVAPDVPFDFTYFDTKLQNNYRNEISHMKLLNMLVIISILISSLGIFGLIMEILVQRTKEIGIRKVNGARTAEVMLMLNRDFIKWVVIAFAVACPITWYAMYKWLENFAYKTSLSWWVFAIAGATALFIALLTVSWQSWRAATRNPVESLRYE